MAARCHAAAAWRTGAARPGAWRQGCGQGAWRALSPQHRALSVLSRPLTIRHGGSLYPPDAPGRSARLSTTNAAKGAAAKGPAPAKVGAATFHFSEGPELAANRGSCAAVVIGKFCVLIGGFNEQDGHLGCTEVIDMSAQEGGAGPSLRMARYDHAAVRVDAENLMVIGGFNKRTLATTEIMSLEDAATNPWLFKPGPSLPSPRMACAAVLLKDEKTVLVIGGGEGVLEHVGPGKGGPEWEATATTELLDLATMSFTPGPKMLEPRMGCAAIVLENGNVLVLGGQDDEGDSLQTTEILDLKTMHFTTGPLLQTPRSRCCALKLRGLDVVSVIGGQADPDSALATTELLDVSGPSKKWAFIDGPPLRQARFGCAVAALEQGAFVVGGWDFVNGSTSTTELLRRGDEAP
ncbi:hypothetical protein M885DRAFT_511678 [Pelagophyceae sp. CCMP2097]|nr:hypothetical protein M885DRAFT_511678 [Pelagophyceae sp. CCMP2097]